MPSHTKRCQSANRFGSAEDFDCICDDGISKEKREIGLLLADVAQIAFTECFDRDVALHRIRELLGPHRPPHLPLADRIETLCKESEQTGDSPFHVLVTSLRREIVR